MTVPVTEMDVAPAARSVTCRSSVWPPRCTRSDGAPPESVRPARSSSATSPSVATTPHALRLSARRARGDRRHHRPLPRGWRSDARPAHLQRHAAPDTTSTSCSRGGRGFEPRRVHRHDHITPNGRGSNANQSNRIINLSPDAWASRAQLEIEHNDVKCSHASTVGPIDEEQRFYLESRGVPPEAAERLVVNGSSAR